MISKFQQASFSGSKLGEVIKTIGAGLGSALINFAITEIISGLIIAVGHAEELRKKAQQVGEQFKTARESINDFADQIQKSYEIINDEHSTVEDTVKEREKLLELQKELLDIYGDSEKAVAAINKLIDSQGKEVDDLINLQFEAAKKEFNDNGNWWESFWRGASNFVRTGNTDNWDTMLSEMETDKYRTFAVSPFIDKDSEGYKTFKQQVNELLGENAITDIDQTETLQISADTLQEFVDKLKTVQSLANNYGLQEYFQGVDSAIDESKKTLSQYEEMYNQYILSEKIIKSENPAVGRIYRDYISEYEKYRDARIKGDDEATKNSISKMGDLREELGNLEGVDQSVLDYFNDLYPELKAEIANWRFSVGIDVSLNLPNEQAELDKYFSEGGEYHNVSIEKLKSYDDLGVQNEITSLFGVIAAALNTTYDSVVDMVAEKYNLLTQTQIEAINIFKNKVGKAIIEGMAPEDYAEMLKIDPSTINSYYDLADAIIEARKQSNKFSTSQMVDELVSLDDGFDKLDKLYADVKDGGKFDFAKLSSKQFEESFAGFKEEYTALVEAVAASPNAMSEGAQEAFNTLVTKYVEQSKVVKGLSKDTQELVDNYLTMIGVTNANAWTTAKLTQIEEDEARANTYSAWAKEHNAKATSELDQVSLSLQNATIEDIRLFNQSAEAANLDRKQLALLELTKIDLAKTDLTNQRDLDYLIKLASYAGIASTSLIELQDIQRRMGDILEAYNSTKDPHKGDDYRHEYDKLKSDAEKIQEKIKKDLQDAANSNLNLDLNMDYNSPTAQENDSKAGEKTDETFDWIEVAIKRVQEALSRLTKVRDNTYKTWSIRNEALSGELQKTYEELSLQQAGFDAYMQAFNEIELDDEWKQLIANGGLRIDEISDSALKDQIKDAQDFYNKAIACSDAVEDLKKQLSDLAKTRFDNLATSFDNQLSLISERQTQLENAVANMEEHGYAVASVLYENSLAAEQENLAGLINKRNALLNDLNASVESGDIEAYSEEWYNLRGQVAGVTSEIQQSETAIVKWNNSIRELEWENFDRVLSSISRITDESNFLIDILSDEKLFGESGNFTNEGLATVGLHGINWETEMRKAREYGDELADIQKEIAKDPNNQKLIDRQRELEDAQWDAVKAAQAEKKAMIELAQEGIQKAVDAMSELINKTKERISTEKDLYDFQRDIAKKTKAISDLQKQLNAYSMNDSEEGKRRVQELQNQLKEAQDDLEQTEYDRWVSDTQDMLDDLMTDYEELMTALSEDTEKLFMDLQTDVNNNYKDIESTITTAAGQLGVDISEAFANMFKNDSPLITAVQSKDYTSYFDKITGVGGVIDTIKTNNDNMIQTLGGYGQALVQAINDAAAAFSTNTGQQNIPPSAGTFEYNHGGNGGSGGGNGGGSNNSYTPPATIPSDTTSIEEQSKKKTYTFTPVERRTDPDTGEIMTLYSGGYGTYKGIYSDNNIASVLGYTIAGTKGNIELTASQVAAVFQDLKKRGYKTGLHKAKKDEWAWTSEDGAENIYRASDGAIYTPISKGDKVYTAEMAENLWNLAKGNYSLPMVNGIKPNILQNTTTTAGDFNMNGLTINLAGVDNPEQFANKFVDILKNDTKVQKALRSSTVDLLAGKSKYAVNKY